VKAFLAAAAVLAFSAPAPADQVFLREPEVPRALFGENAAAVRKTLVLSDAELAALSKALERKVELRSYPYLEVSSPPADAGEPPRLLGQVFILEVVGQSLPITFAVGVKADGTLQDLQVMVYREPHGDEVRERRFRAQFSGKTLQDPLVVGKDIDAITGATISSGSAAYAARKGLALAEVLRQRSKGKAP
jgi:H+/Na+-translocating ferredoxin:NAD+ oxidoreductase subunit G